MQMRQPFRGYRRRRSRDELPAGLTPLPIEIDMKTLILVLALAEVPLVMAQRSDTAEGFSPGPVEAIVATIYIARYTESPEAARQAQSA